MFQHYDWIGDFISKNYEAQTKEGFLYFINHDIEVMNLYKEACNNLFFREIILLTDKSSQLKEIYITATETRNLIDSGLISIFDIFTSNKLSECFFSDEYLNGKDKYLESRKFKEIVSTKTGILYNESMQKILSFTNIDEIETIQMDSSK